MFRQAAIRRELVKRGERAEDMSRAERFGAPGSDAMRFFRSFRRAPDEAPGIPAGRRLYVVGDIHGRLDLLHRLERRIEQDLATAPAEVTTIFLGDYVDRGPETAGVLEKLSAGAFCTPLVALRGNHEEVMLRFLSDASVLGSWRHFGGLETLHSYGVDVSEALRGAGFDRAQRALADALPARHRAFLAGAPLSAEVGGYFFCHAGVRPGVALDRQGSDDLLWSRAEFLEFCGSFGKVVVHGHTPTAQPEIRTNRINVDTGAYASSVLTALVLEGETRRFLSTAAPGD
jgi:serine/threonine protein phosphatase 1